MLHQRPAKAFPKQCAEILRGKPKRRRYVRKPDRLRKMLIQISHDRFFLPQTFIRAAGHVHFFYQRIVRAHRHDLQQGRLGCQLPPQTLPKAGTNEAGQQTVQRLLPRLPFPHLPRETQMSLGQRFQQAGFGIVDMGKLQQFQRKQKRVKLVPLSCRPYFMQLLTSDEKDITACSQVCTVGYDKRNRPRIDNDDLALRMPMEWHAVNHIRLAPVQRRIYAEGNADSGLFLPFALCFHPSPSLKSCY